MESKLTESSTRKIQTKFCQIIKELQGIDTKIIWTDNKLNYVI